MKTAILKISIPLCLTLLANAGDIMAAPVVLLPYPDALPLGKLTINCQISTTTAVPGGSFRITKSVYTTKNLLDDLAHDLGVSFPEGSYLEVFTIPYDGTYPGFGGLFPVASTGTKVMVESPSGRSWEVTSYVRVTLPDYSYVAVIQGSIGSEYNDPTTATLLFTGEVFRFTDPDNTIVLNGSTSFSYKTTPRPAFSNNLALSASILMRSGSAFGGFRGRVALITGRMLISGTSTWNITF